MVDARTMVKETRIDKKVDCIVSESVARMQAVKEDMETFFNMTVTAKNDWDLYDMQKEFCGVLGHFDQVLRDYIDLYFGNHVR